jgi:hypothetical protein
VITKEERKLGEESVVYVKNHEVIGRLDALRLTDDLLRDSVREGIAHRLACTKNDPDYLLGILGSGKITRALRDRLMRKPHDWKRETYLNQPSTVRPDGKIAIVVAGGTEDTGVEGGQPATRSAKGQATRDAVDRNQMSFSAVDASFRRFDPPEPTDETWMLLYYIDEERGEVRAELSLPRFMDEDNYVTDWKERVILSAIPIDRPQVALSANEEGDEGQYDADVQPRVG